MISSAASDMYRLNKSVGTEKNTVYDMDTKHYCKMITNINM